MNRIYQGSVVVVFLSFACAVAAGLPGFNRIIEIPSETFSLACHLLQIGGISVALLVKGNQTSSLGVVLRRPTGSR